MIRYARKNVCEKGRDWIHTTFLNQLEMEIITFLEETSLTLFLMCLYIIYEYIYYIEGFNNKTKRNKWDCSTPINFCLIKETINEMDRQPERKVQIPHV